MTNTNFFIWILVLLVVIILALLLAYLEIPRYLHLSYSGSKELKRLAQHYKCKKRVKSQHRVVLSLTTIPDRIDHIAPTLSSLLWQTRRVDEIRLNLPYVSMKGDKYHIPKWLEKCPAISIHRVEKDWGPSTKLLPTTQDEQPDTCILVVDDDNIYGSHYVQNMVQGFYQHKGKCVVTKYGCDVEDGAFQRNWNYMFGSGQVDYVFGCGGFIIQPRMLPPQIYRYDLGPEEAKYVDDNWISGWLNLNGCQVQLVEYKYGGGFFPNLQTLDCTALSQTVNVGNRNVEVTDDWFLKKGAYG